MNKPTVINQLSFAVLIIAICCALFAYKLVVNYVQPILFLTYLLLISIAIFGFIAVILRFLLKNVIMPYVFLLSGIGFLFFIGVVLNNSIVISEKCTVAQITDRKKEITHTKQGSPLTTYSLSVLMNGVKKSITCNQQIWYYSDQGNSLNICIRKGFLGGEYYVFK